MQSGPRLGMLPCTYGGERARGEHRTSGSFGFEQAAKDRAAVMSEDHVPTACKGTTDEMNS